MRPLIAASFICEGTVVEARSALELNARQLVPQNQRRALATGASVLKIQRMQNFIVARLDFSKSYGK